MASGSRAHFHIYKRWSDAEETMFAVALATYPETDQNRWEKAAAMIRTKSPVEVHTHWRELEKHLEEMKKQEHQHDGNDNINVEESNANVEVLNVEEYPVLPLPNANVEVLPANVEAEEPPIGHAVEIEVVDNAVLEHMLHEQQQQNPQQQMDNAWPIRKRLSKSDIEKRLIIRKKVFNEYIRPVINALFPNPNYVTGVELSIRDIDTGHISNSVTLKRWGRKRSYVLVDGWIGDFAGRRELKLYDEIGLCWDYENNMLNFSVLYRNYA